MRGASARGRKKEAEREFQDRHFDRFRGEHADIDANSADEVISEIGLVLVITLGVVVAMNMILVALHIG
jgi:hypothetical protein